MQLSLSTPEGDAVEVTPVEMPEDVKAAADAFHRTQANEPLAGEAMRPPKRPVADKTDPGYTPNPAPRRGRPKKDDPEASRITAKVPASAPKGKEPLKPKDFTQGLMAATDGIWMATGMLPNLAAQKTSILIKTNQPQLVATLNAGAQSNAMVRKVVSLVAGEGEGNGFLLGAAFLGYGMYMQAQALNSNPELLAQAIEANTRAITQSMENMFGAIQEQTAGV